MIQFGNDKIKDIYVGSDQIKEVYYGSEKVWGEVVSIQDGYWVHKDTGVKTYFGLEDPSIRDGRMYPPSWKLDCSEVQLPSGITGLVIYCFEECTSLTSINIPEGVVSLGTNCFFRCSSLTSITLPESLTSIGLNCFRNCSSLTLATVLPSTPPSLGGFAFGSVHESFNIQVRYPYVDAYKTSTNWIEYADKISAIQDGYWVHKDTGVKTYFYADADFIYGGIMNSPSWMYDCSDVQIPTGVTGLGEECFAYCTALTSITLPEGVTSLGMYCFDGCYALTSITLPESVISLGEGCFYQCKSLASINIPEGVTILGNNCFYYCPSLASINIPEGVTILGDHCFEECTSLASINIPEGVTILGDHCFYQCNSLTSITLPEGVTSLGENCFRDCTSLTLATVLPATPPTLGWRVFNDVHSSFNIKVRSPYVDDYKTATNWINYADKISAI